MRLIPASTFNNPGFARDLAVPPGHRVVSAKPIKFMGETYYEVEVSPQRWNPRYWLYRWQISRAVVIELGIDD